MKLLRLFACLIAALVLFTGRPHQIALRGAFVTPDTVIEQGTVLISGVKIQGVGQKLPVPEKATQSQRQGRYDSGLKYASVWNDGQYPKIFTDADLVQMVTSIPAQLAGLSEKIGSIKPGYVADILVMRRTEKDPYQSLRVARRRATRPDRRRSGLRRRRPFAQARPCCRDRASHRLRFTQSSRLLHRNHSREHPTLGRQTVDQLSHALNEWGLGPVQLTPCLN